MWGAMSGLMMVRRSLLVGTDDGNGIIVGGGRGGIIPRSDKCPGGGEMPPPLLPPPVKAGARCVGWGGVVRRGRSVSTMGGRERPTPSSTDLRCPQGGIQCAGSCGKQSQGRP